MEEIKKTIGQRIRKRRLELNLSQNEVAELSNISNNYMCSLEKGEYLPKIDKLLNICAALDINPDYLLCGVINPNNISKNIIDKLRLCTNEQLSAISSLIDYFIYSNHSSK